MYKNMINFLDNRKAFLQQELTEAIRVGKMNQQSAYIHRIEELGIIKSYLEESNNEP